MAKSRFIASLAALTVIAGSLIPATVMAKSSPDIKLCIDGRCGTYKVINPMIEPDDEDGQISATVVLRNGNQKDGFAVGVMCGGDSGASIMNYDSGHLLEVPRKHKNVKYKNKDDFILYNVWKTTCSMGVKR